MTKHSFLRFVLLCLGVANWWRAINILETFLMMMTLSGREKDSGDKSDLCLRDYNIIDDNDGG